MENVHPTTNRAVNSTTVDLSDFTPSDDLTYAATMPARWYTDPALLELEKEKIFWQTWQPVGRVADVMRPGDFFACDVLGEPIVVTRGTDQKLRAFYNVCRHRGAAIARGRGNRKSLQCMYHGWTYGLDGRLMRAPEFEGVGDWNAKDVCLPEVKVETWGPWVFVNLDADAPSMSETSYGTIHDEIISEGFNIDNMTLIERRDYIIDCNWKVYVDNYLEGYHLPTAHPGLFRELDYDNYRVETFSDYSKQHAPIRPAKSTGGEIRDRRYIRDESDAEAKALYYWIFPNVMLNIYLDNTSINIILPLGHDKTLTIFEWYFEQPGTGEGWESMQQIIAFSDQIQQEDIEICEIVQKGLQSRSYDTGRFSVLRENGVHHFQSLIHASLTKS
jgi:choline monooxygenase